MTMEKNGKAAYKSKHNIIKLYAENRTRYVRTRWTSTRQQKKNNPWKNENFLPQLISPYQNVTRVAKGVRMVDDLYPQNKKKESGADLKFP